jgi:hypothetical protein
MAALPNITSLLYAPGPSLGVIQAVLDAVPQQTVTGALFQGAPQGTGWIASGTNTANIVRITAVQNSLNLETSPLY